MKKRPTLNKQSLLKAGVDFHGHLGPYLVIGLRMGMVAVQMLKPKQLHELSATVWTGRLPPQSCVLDGIQVSSGCTLGKGNIIAREARRTSARFRKGSQAVLIRPTAKAARLLGKISNRTPQLKLQAIALALDRLPDPELFAIKLGTERSR